MGVSKYEDLIMDTVLFPHMKRTIERAAAISIDTKVLTTSNMDHQCELPASIPAKDSKGSQNKAITIIMLISSTL